ncbi:anhydro-N-acetylmuramic acid kinase [Aestuariibius sp. 2305UL40-4]|uniref:anhydro-N-acetylmuramic acid kinase n=1 Tax=Aestuariibius violaceus TaxID=3234132 RepID=UPI00345E1EF1
MRVLGCMSGTSLDGIDAAVIETDGHSIHGFGPSGYRPYTPEERQVLRAALGQWDGAAVEAAARVVEAAHIELLGQFAEVNIVGFHGQTLAHAPDEGRTLQVGSGEVLADALGLPVVWDFRSEDVATGGQGAPLAPFYHHACAGWIGAKAPLAFLNLGGIGNLTWCDPAAGDPAEPGALIAFDTGPANAPVDELMQARQGVSHDADGVLALSGTASEALVEEALAHPFYRKVPPKSLDRLDVTGLVETVLHLGDADAAATLAAISASAVVRGLEHCPTLPAAILVSGGGRRNGAIMAMLAERSGLPVAPVEDRGLDGDMLEAQAFAFLAARVMAGLPTSAPGTTGVWWPVRGGRLARPGQELELRNAAL